MLSLNSKKKYIMLACQPLLAKQMTIKILINKIVKECLSCNAQWQTGSFLKVPSIGFVL